MKKYQVKLQRTIVDSCTLTVEALNSDAAEEDARALCAKDDDGVDWELESDELEVLENDEIVEAEGEDLLEG